MEDNKTEVIPPKEPDRPRKEMTEEQRQKQKKLIVYPAMFIAFAVVMWLIFAPSDKEQAEQQQGFNTDMPMPTDNKLVDDKQKAYEQDMFNKKQNERRELQDLASMFGGDEQQEDELYLEEEPSKPVQSYGGGGGSARPQETVYASANAYRDMNRVLGNFYETPKEDPEKEELKQKLDEMNARLQEAESTPKTTMDDQIALMEKSYELAARYNQNTNSQQQPFGQSNTTNTTTTEEPELIKNGKAVINNVGQVRERVVSGLSQPISDSTFMSDYSQPRNLGFHTAVGNDGEKEKNTIKACVHDNQTITDGQAVRMRLLEPMKAGRTVIPKNALVTGMGKIQGERLGITITSLEYEGLIIPVELTVIDTDGQKGIFIPGSMEIDAIKEIAANLGGNLGTTINLNQQSAGDQLLTDLGKGAIQGTSQYIAKKMRIVKVHLKAGYNLMLYQNRQ